MSLPTKASQGASSQELQERKRNSTPFAVDSNQYPVSAAAGFRLLNSLTS